MLAGLSRLLPAEAETRLRRDLARMQAFRDRGWPRLARLMARLIQRRYGVFIAPQARIAPGVRFPHPTGIVIGEGVVVQDRVTIYQNVTLGGARTGDWRAGNYPEIGAGSTIFAGAVVAGRLRVGQGCTIGANAVVLRDVPDGATAVGAPAHAVMPDAAIRRRRAASGA
jgi:serine O-acetyltransferase